MIVRPLLRTAAAPLQRLTARLTYIHLNNVQTHAITHRSLRTRTPKHSSVQAKYNTQPPRKYKMATKNPLVWIDCEMSGLDHEKDKILQIVCFVTDYDLNLLDDKGFETIISRPKELLDGMDEWCTKTHDETGLTKKVLNATTTPKQACELLLKYIQRFVPERNIGLLCGNSIQQDQQFLRDEFKPVIQWLHYRIGDVSSIKEFARRWCPYDVIEGTPLKKYTHEARQDILESIEEARYYKDVLFSKAKVAQISSTTSGPIAVNEGSANIKHPEKTPEKPAEVKEDKV